MDNSNKTINQASGFLIGAVVGGVLGVLFAPNKGSETRRQIANSKDNFTNSVKDQYGNMVNMVNDEIDMVKNKANELMENGIAKAEKAKSNFTA
jgi:gas vesicle protein